MKNFLDLSRLQAVSVQFEPNTSIDLSVPFLFLLFVYIYIFIFRDFYEKISHKL